VHNSDLCRKKKVDRDFLADISTIASAVVEKWLRLPSYPVKKSARYALASGVSAISCVRELFAPLTRSRSDELARRHAGTTEKGLKNERLPARSGEASYCGDSLNTRSSTSTDIGLAPRIHTHSSIPLN